MRYRERRIYSPSTQSDSTGGSMDLTFMTHHGQHWTGTSLILAFDVSHTRRWGWRYHTRKENRYLIDRAIFHSALSTNFATACRPIALMARTTITQLCVLIVQWALNIDYRRCLKYHGFAHTVSGSRKSTVRPASYASCRRDTARIFC